MQKIKGNMKLIIGLILGIFISAITSYAVAETLIQSADVSYVDNAKLGATNVQSAIDGTCTKFSTELQSFLLKVYPVGSIYISYSSTNPGTLFGGTWVAYGKGQTLVGIDSSQTEFNTVGKTGGTKNVSTTLKESNLPSHSHVIPSLSGNTSENGSHRHILDNNLVGWGKNDANTYFKAGPSLLVGAIPGPVSEQGNLLYVDYTNDSMSLEGSHTHTVTTTASATTTCTNCNGTAFSTSTLQPYVTVYMWRRTN